MEQTFILILAVSAWTLGIYFATYEGQVLHQLKAVSEKGLGKLAMPMLGCPYCMPSLHGLVIWFLFHMKHIDYCRADGWLFLQYLFVVAASSALNNLLFNGIEALRNYNGLYEPTKPEENE